MTCLDLCAINRTFLLIFILWLQLLFTLGCLSFVVVVMVVWFIVVVMVVGMERRNYYLAPLQSWYISYGNV